MCFFSALSLALWCALRFGLFLWFGLFGGLICVVVWSAWCLCAFVSLRYVLAIFGVLICVELLYILHLRTSVHSLYTRVKYEGLLFMVCLLQTD